MKRKSGWEKPIWTIVAEFGALPDVSILDEDVDVTFVADVVRVDVIVLILYVVVVIIVVVDVASAKNDKVKDLA